MQIWQKTTYYMLHVFTVQPGETSVLVQVSQNKFIAVFNYCTHSRTTEVDLKVTMLYKNVFMKGKSLLRKFVSVYWETEFNTASTQKANTDIFAAMRHQDLKQENSYL
jgi:hypothetical protein